MVRNHLKTNTIITAMNSYLLEVYIMQNTGYPSILSIK